MPKIELPVLIVNFKIYPQSIGNNALKLAKIMEKVSNEFSASLIAVPSLPDLAIISENVDIPVFSQHTDPIELGANTGHISAFHLKEIGVSGSLLNHSERRIKIDHIKQAIEQLNHNTLYSVVCAADPLISKAVASLEPWAVAMEPPELIGGDVSVTTKPEIVEETINRIKEASKKVIPLVGAGVKSPAHLEEALRMGSHGVLLASGITKSKDPETILTKMAKVLINY